MGPHRDGIRVPCGLFFGVMDARDATVEPEQGEAVRQDEPPRGRRRWLLRLFVLTLLLAGAGTVGLATVSIVSAAKGTDGLREAEFGVLMPDATAYRTTVLELLERKEARPLRGLTVVGGEGQVTLLGAQDGKASFPSAYLNPNALSVIARSIGVRSDTQIDVEELRLEVLERTGRLRWRLRGTQGGRPWRAVVAPNGTKLRVISVATTA